MRRSVVPGTKWDLERETGLEPATFGLEGAGGYALCRRKRRLLRGRRDRWAFEGGDKVASGEACESRG